MTAHDTATQFITRCFNQHLDSDRIQLIERTTQHLIEAHDISRPTAIDVAYQAWAEIESVKNNSTAYIDMQRTTSYAVFLRIPGETEPTVFTSADLQVLAWQH